MASAVAGGLAKGIGSGVVKILFQQYGGALAQDKSALIQKQLADIQASITSSEKRIIEEIKLEVGKNEFQNCITDIESRMITLENAARMKADGYPKDWNDHIAHIWSTRSDRGGLDNSLLHIHNIMMGGGAKSGLLYNYIRSHHELLATQDPKYGINWYLAEVDKYMDGVLSIQLKGLAIQVSMSIMSEQPERTMKIYGDTMWRQLEAQINYAFECLHSTVRKLKKNYYTAIDWTRFWQLQVPDGRVLHSEGADLEVQKQNPSGSNSWRFVSAKTRDAKFEVDQVFVQRGSDGQPFIRGVYIMDYHPTDLQYHELIRCTSNETSYNDMANLFSDVNRKLKKQIDYDLPLKIAPRKDDDGFLFLPPAEWPSWKHWFWRCTFYVSDSCALYRPPPPDHLYTLDRNGEGKVDGGYRFQNVVGYIYNTSQPDSAAFRRWAFPNGDHHYYSCHADGEGVDGAQEGYIHQGVIGYCPGGSADGAVALWRSYNPKTASYYCTADANDPPDYIRQGGVASVFPVQKEGTVPLLHFFREG